MTKKATCFGAGLVALDVILNGSVTTTPMLSAGGSCGNVLSILSFLGWNSYPIARLANDQAGHELMHDLDRWHIHSDHIFINDEGVTPIIIHRILKDKKGNPIHRFEFRDPETKSWLPQFKAITKNVAEKVINKNIIPEVFYFDRMNPGTLELARHFKANGSLIYFEPSSAKDSDTFEKFLAVSDIVKFSHERIPDYEERYNQIQCFLEVKTIGESGLVFRSRKNTHPNTWNTIKAPSINNLQDAAGAGDWCSAGIISCLGTIGKIGLKNATVSEIKMALNFGQTLGALNCLYDGSRGLMYYYTSQNLLSTVDYCYNMNVVAPKYTISAPIIDVSTTKKLSDLYQISY